MPSIDNTIQTTIARLSEAKIDTAPLDATILLSKATGYGRLELILNGEEEISPQAAKDLEKMLARREKREPIAYILEEKEFWGLPFKVRAGVLIPRPDTETLIATVLALLPNKNVNATVADVGVGSGCILLSLLSECPNLQGIGVDISQAALDVTAENAEALGLDKRINLIKGEGAEKLPENLSLIVSNPPYIAEAEITTLQPEVAKYEPKEALAGGADGLGVYRSLIPQAYAKLHSGGLLALEIGHTQKEEITKLLEEKKWQGTKCYQDLANRNRVIISIKR